MAIGSTAMMQAPAAVARAHAPTEEMVREWRGKAKGMVRRWVSQHKGFWRHADEIEGEALLALARALRDYSPAKGAFGAFASRCIGNAIVSWVRKLCRSVHARTYNICDQPTAEWSMKYGKGEGRHGGIKNELAEDVEPRGFLCLEVAAIHATGIADAGEAMRAAIAMVRERLDDRDRKVVDSILAGKGVRRCFPGNGGTNIAKSRRRIAAAFAAVFGAGADRIAA